MGMGPAKQIAEVMKGHHSMIPSFTFVVDPLVAKNLKEEEGFKTREDLCKWLRMR